MKLQIIEKCGKFCVKETHLGFIPLYFGYDGFWFWPDESSYGSRDRAEDLFNEIQAEYLLMKDKKYCKPNIIKTVHLHG